MPRQVFKSENCLDLRSKLCLFSPESDGRYENGRKINFVHTTKIIFFLHIIEVETR